jgi:hypothetical protein
MRRPRQRFGRPPWRLAARVPAHYSVVHCRKNARRSCTSLPIERRPQPEAARLLPPRAASRGTSSRPGHPGSLTPTPRGCGNRAPGARPSQPQQGMVACAPPSLDGLGLSAASPAPRRGGGLQAMAPRRLPLQREQPFFRGRNGLAIAGAGPGNGTGYHASDDPSARFGALRRGPPPGTARPPSIDPKPERHLQPVAPARSSTDCERAQPSCARPRRRRPPTILAR